MRHVTPAPLGWLVKVGVLPVRKMDYDVAREESGEVGICVLCVCWCGLQYAAGKILQY